MSRRSWHLHCVRCIHHSVSIQSCQLHLNIHPPNLKTYGMLYCALSQTTACVNDKGFLHRSRNDTQQLQLLLLTQFCASNLHQYASLCDSQFDHFRALWQDHEKRCPPTTTIPQIMCEEPGQSILRLANGVVSCTNLSQTLAFMNILHPEFPTDQPELHLVSKQ